MTTDDERPGRVHLDPRTGTNQPEVPRYGPVEEPGAGPVRLTPRTGQHGGMDKFGAAADDDDAL